MNETQTQLDIDREKGNFRYNVDYEFDAGTGLNEKTIDYICDVKDEPDWIRKFRKDALKNSSRNRCPPIGPRTIWKTLFSTRSATTSHKAGKNRKDLGRSAGGRQADL